MPPIRPANSQSRGSSDGVSDRQKNNAPTAAPTKSSRTSPQAHSSRGWRCGVMTLTSREQSRQHAFPGAAQFGQRNAELALDLDAVGTLVHHADPHGRQRARLAHRDEAAL